MISSIQSKMARAALGWGVRELAQAAQVGTMTVVRFENEKGGSICSTIKAMKRAYEDHGVSFSEDGGVRPPTSGKKQN
jgi:DNA-binding XRE family transcriptional regulator